jgi:hypothetical protein
VKYWAFIKEHCINGKKKDGGKRMYNVNKYLNNKKEKEKEEKKLMMAQN